MIRQQALLSQSYHSYGVVVGSRKKFESSVNERSDSYVTRGAQPCHAIAGPVSIEPDRGGARKRREGREIGGKQGTEAEISIVLRQVGLGGWAGVCKF